MKSIPNDIQFVNLGSTYSQYAFGCYKELGLDKTYNLALPCESSEADYVKLKLLYSHFAPGCVVAITLAPCNTLYYWGQLNEGVKHYGFMPKTLKKDWSFLNYLKYYFPIFPFDIRKIARLLFDTRLKRNIFDQGKAHLFSEEEVKRMVKATAEGWMNMYGLTDLKQQVCNEDKITIIKDNSYNITRIIDFCEKQSFLPIIVIPPFHHQLNSYFSEPFLNSTLGPVLNVAKERGVNIYDFREHPDFQHNSHLYIDGFFCLNEHGSEIFVKKLFERMNQDGFVVNNEKLRV